MANFFDDAVSFSAFDAPIGGPQTFLGSGTFDNSGVSSYTGEQYGPNLPTLPTLSSGSSAGTTGVAPTSAASSGSANNPLQFTTGAGSADMPIVGPSSGATSQGGTIADYFIRAVVIILGFIFVAIGLSMFRGREVVLSKAG